MGYRSVDSMNLIELYKTVYLIRKSEYGIQTYYHEDEMKTPMHMSMGSEAIVAGVCHALKSDDKVFGTYRSHALYLAKTHDVEGFFAEMYGKITGQACGKAGSMHLSFPFRGHMGSSAIVGTPIPVAVGAAFANKFRDESHIAACFFGDGATDEGTFWESLNLSCAMKIPVLFVCENNNFAVHTPRCQRQGYESFANVVSQFNCFVEETKTTNPVEIFHLVSSLLNDIRTHQMPGILLAEYYRYLEHVGVNEDFEAGYRNRSDAEEWFKRDPVKIMRQIVIDSYGAELVTEVEENIDALVELSIVKSKSSDFPLASEVVRGVLNEDDIL